MNSIDIQTRHALEVDRRRHSGRCPQCGFRTAWLQQYTDAVKLLERHMKEAGHRA